ncbi:MAG: hypothetical protein QM296_07260 [Bacillota bacterium]|nr:hypothetical protein [Bacillota bacterium]
MSSGGQKLRWCPETRAGTKKLSTAGQKRAFVPRNRGRNEKIGHTHLLQLAVQHRRFLFFFFHHKVAGMIGIRGSHDTAPFRT